MKFRILFRNNHIFYYLKIPVFRNSNINYTTKHIDSMKFLKTTLAHARLSSESQFARRVVGEVVGYTFFKVRQNY
jgi:hypothetical protein